ncbi:MAG: hypothetical protein QM687_03075 [Ferruginibacter sp.]
MNTVVIRTYYSPIPARITAAKLSDAGVESFIWGEDAVQTIAFSNSLNGAIQLVVKEEDAAKARQLLYEFDEEYRKAAVCPRCGRNDFIVDTRLEYDNSLLAFFSKFFSVNPTSGKSVYQCKNCGYESESLPEPPEDHAGKDLL